MRKISVMVAMLALISLSGCVYWGGFSNNGFSSKTNLKGPGHKVVKSVNAKADVMYILGAILLDAEKADLYERAMTDIRKQAGLEGQSYALANVTTDIVTKDFLVVRFVTLYVSADVVEFTK